MEKEKSVIVTAVQGASNQPIELNGYLNDGWTVKSVTPLTPSVTSAPDNCWTAALVIIQKPSD